MKSITCAVVVGLLTSFASVHAMAQNHVLATSPDHPKTWEVGAAKSHLALRWDSAKQMLVADVAYSTEMWATDAHPTEVEDYTISFPGVKFDGQEGIFTANGVTVARLHHSWIGNDIVVEKGVQLSVHRHDGLIFGALTTSRNA